MNFLIALAVGALGALALYNFLSECRVKKIVGLGLLGLVTNLLLFFSGGSTFLPAAFVKQVDPANPVTDPLPQALILTAIVIGFGLLIFSSLLLSQDSSASKDSQEET